LLTRKRGMVIVTVTLLEIGGGNFGF